MTSRNALRHTASDAYFQAHHKRIATSSNVYVPLSQPTDGDDSSTAVVETDNVQRPSLPPEVSYDALDFARWMLELQEGFNLVLYGYGSKLKALEEFAETCSSYGDVVWVEGLGKRTDAEPLLRSIEEGLSLDFSQSRSRNHESRTQSIVDFYSTSEHPLFLLLTSIALPLAPKDPCRNILHQMGSCPRIRIVTTIEHLDASVIWSLRNFNKRELLTTQDKDYQQDLHNVFSPSMLWHEVTTFQPYTTELHGRNLYSHPYFKSNSRAQDSSKKAGALITESAANHILASVTDRARKLFQLIATRQLSQGASTDSASMAQSSRNSHLDEGVPYATMFLAARDGFLASNDSQMKTLLSEFADHGLVVTMQGGQERDSNGELLWIAMGRESLQKLLTELEA